METIPIYSTDLIDQLDEAYGSYLPHPLDGFHDGARWYALGQRAVVDRLREIQKLEEERDHNL